MIYNNNMMCNNSIHGMLPTVFNTSGSSEFVSCLIGPDYPTILGQITVTYSSK